jgi:hypothetical protein
MVVQHPQVNVAGIELLTSTDEIFGKRSVVRV